KGPEAGCISQGGSGGQCLVGHGFLAPMDVASAGANVYVASTGSNAVDVIAKDPDSRQFRQKSGPGGCVSETDGSCNLGRGLTGAASVATDPSGEFIYVGGDHTIAVLRDRRAG